MNEHKTLSEQEAPSNIPTTHSQIIWLLVKELFKNSFGRLVTVFTFLKDQQITYASDPRPAYKLGQFNSVHAVARALIFPLSNQVSNAHHALQSKIKRADEQSDLEQQEHKVTPEEIEQARNELGRLLVKSQITSLTPGLFSIVINQANVMLFPVPEADAQQLVQLYPAYAAPSILLLSLVSAQNIFAASSEDAAAQMRVYLTSAITMGGAYALTSQYTSLNAYEVLAVASTAQIMHLYLGSLLFYAVRPSHRYLLRALKNSAYWKRGLEETWPLLAEGIHTAWPQVCELIGFNLTTGVLDRNPAQSSAYMLTQLFSSIISIVSSSFVSPLIKQTIFYDHVIQTPELLHTVMNRLRAHTSWLGNIFSLPISIVSMFAPVWVMDNILNGENLSDDIRDAITESLPAATFLAVEMIFKTAAQGIISGLRFTSQYHEKLSKYAMLINGAAPLTSFVVGMMLIEMGVPEAQAFYIGAVVCNGIAWLGLSHLAKNAVNARAATREAQSATVSSNPSSLWTRSKQCLQNAGSYIYSYCPRM